MRPLTVVAIALLVPSLAAAQQPSTPPSNPVPPPPAAVVVPAPVVVPPADTTPAPAAAGPASIATIAPGMAVAEVEAAWGKAGVTRTDGDQTFLFYRNDCLKRCGTFDVVMLQDGKVVDAIVRASYHRYSGTSSSPEGRRPSFTRPNG